MLANQDDELVFGRHVQTSFNIKQEEIINCKMPSYERVNGQFWEFRFLEGLVGV
jgi:hypothetical protein